MVEDGKRIKQVRNGGWVSWLAKRRAGAQAPGWEVRDVLEEGQVKGRLTGAGGR